MTTFHQGEDNLILYREKREERQEREEKEESYQMHCDWLSKNSKNWLDLYQHIITIKAPVRAKNSGRQYCSQLRSIIIKGAFSTCLHQLMLCRTYLYILVKCTRR